MPKATTVTKTTQSPEGVLNAGDTTNIGLWVDVASGAVTALPFTVWVLHKKRNNTQK